MISLPKPVLGLVSAVAVFGIAGVPAAMAAPANPRAEVVMSKPTIASLTGVKHPVLYDDGKCPKGQIAQFSKKGGQAQMRRACVDRPN